MNDDCHSALDLAREKGHGNVVRAIENQICLFSGWLREQYGPGFLGAFAPQLMSRKIWTVVLPCDSRNPTRPLKFELAIYPEVQVAKPRTVISLWKAHLEEPKFNQPDPAVVIVDKATRTRYKFLSTNEGDKQQLQWFYNACRGIPQVINNIPVPPVGGMMPPPSQTGSYASAALTGTHTGNQEDAELAMAINASIQSAIAEGVPDVQTITQTSNTNGWGSTSDNSTHNGWGPPDAAASSKMNAQAHPNEPNASTYNGWAAPEVRPNNGASCPTASQPDAPTITTSNEAPPTVLVPSAPPIVEEMFYDGPIQYPSIDSSPVDLSMPTTEIRPTTNEVKEDGASASSFSKPGGNEVKEGNSSTSGSCAICLDAPVEGACIPCGHMAGCMPCLKEIKTKNWGCPVCRAKIDQVIKLYSV